MCSYTPRDCNNRDMKIQFKLTAMMLAFAACTSTHAQVDNYLQDFKFPTELAAPGAMVVERSSYYLKTPNPFGVDVLAAEQARLKFPEGKADTSVWVDFKSAVITQAINEQLKIRGVTLAPSKDVAGLILRGDISYYSANHPYSGRRLVLDQRLDNASLFGGNAADSSRTVARSVWDLAPAYKFRGTDPVTFGVGVFSALFDATGLTSALAKARNDEAKMKTDFWYAADCYSKETRKATSCISEGQRLQSYRAKIRIQTIDLKAYLGAPGASNNESQAVHLITRQLDDRSATDISLPELLANSVNELVSGLGQVQSAKE